MGSVSAGGLVDWGSSCGSEDGGGEVEGTVAPTEVRGREEEVVEL